MRKPTARFWCNFPTTAFIHSEKFRSRTFKFRKEETLTHTPNPDNPQRAFISNPFSFHPPCHVSARRWARWYPSFVLDQRTPRYGAGPCSDCRGCITCSRSCSGRIACCFRSGSHCSSAQRWGDGKRFHGQHESGTADEFPGRAQAKGQADTEHRVHEAA